MPRALRALLTLVVAAVLGVAGAGAANASAYGASPIAPFTYSDASGATKSVPRGCALVHTIAGEGTDIRQQTASIDCAGFVAMRSGLFCDVKIDFLYNNRLMDSASTSDCRTIGIRLSNGELPAQVAPGQSCVRLFVNGVSRAQSCHAIGG